MDEIIVDRGEIVALDERVQQLLAHMHQRHGAAGRQIEPAEQFLPARLGSGVHGGGGGVALVFPPGRDGGFQPRVVRPEALGERLEERDARPSGKFGVAAENFAGERHTGGLAAAGEQVFGELDQAFRAG